MSLGQGRPFNALNGEELRKVILADLERQMSEDTRFRAHLTYPQVAYAVAVSLRVYPQPGTADVAFTGRVGSPDPVTGERVSIPPVPVTPALGTFVEGASMTGYRPVSDPDGRVEEPGGSAGAPAHVDEFDAPAPASPFAALSEAALLSQGPVPRTPVEGAEPSGGVESKIPMAGGGPITGGVAKRGPGRPPKARPVESVVEGEIVESARLSEAGVGNSSGVLSSTAVIDNPDAARRELGLPVPRPQMTPGGLVDLPADDAGPSF